MPKNSSPDLNPYSKENIQKNAAIDKINSVKAPEGFQKVATALRNLDPNNGFLKYALDKFAKGEADKNTVAELQSELNSVANKEAVNIKATGGYVMSPYSKKDIDDMSYDELEEVEKKLRDLNETVRRDREGSGSSMMLAVDAQPLRANRIKKTDVPKMYTYVLRNRQEKGKIKKQEEKQRAEQEGTLRGQAIARYGRNSPEIEYYVFTESKKIKINALRSKASEAIATGTGEALYNESMSILKELATMAKEYDAEQDEKKKAIYDTLIEEISVIMMQVLEAVKPVKSEAVAYAKDRIGADMNKVMGA